MSFMRLEVSRTQILRLLGVTLVSFTAIPKRYDSRYFYVVVVLVSDFPRRMRKT